MPHRSFRFLVGASLVLGVTASAVTGWAGQEGDLPAAVEVGETAFDIPGEYVVDLRDDVGDGGVRALFGELGVPFVATALEPTTRIELVQVGASKVASVLSMLRADPRVEYVEPHARVRALFVPDDPMLKDQWHMTQVGAEQAWEFGTGAGVTVAVIDTGIACETQGAFTKATDLGATRCVAGYNFVAGNTHASDDNGHGTHVAGTIAQSTNNGLGVTGLAFGASLMPVKVLSAEGWGTTTAVADGIRWAADNGAQVINLSLGGSRNSKVLQSAVDHARSRGVVVVASAGNSGGQVGYPGGSEGVIGVSATDPSDKLAWFSSRGTGVDIAAPGVDVLQQTICNRGRDQCEKFASYNGTSMASPHVAAAAALLVSQGVTDATKVEAYLLASARQVDDSDNGRALYGAGILNAAEAVRQVAHTQMVARLLALLAMMLVVRRWAGRGGRAQSIGSLGFLLPALATGVGLLFFAPFALGRHIWWVDWLARPVGDWDILLGASVHRLLPLANVLVPLVPAIVLLRVKGMARPLAGVATGTAAYLVATLALGHVATPFGGFLTSAWCGFNALLCLYLGALLLREKAPA